MEKKAVQKIMKQKNVTNYLIKLNEILKNSNPNKKRMLELANSGYITATDLADYLVKNHSMSFRKAYQKTAAVVNLAEKKRKRPVSYTHLRAHETLR